MSVRNFSIIVAAMASAGAFAAEPPKPSFKQPVKVDFGKCSKGQSGFPGVPGIPGASTSSRNPSSSSSAESSAGALASGGACQSLGEAASVSETCDLTKDVSNPEVWNTVKATWEQTNKDALATVNACEGDLKKVREELECFAQEARSLDQALQAATPELVNYSKQMQQIAQDRDMQIQAVEAKIGTPDKPGPLRQLHERIKNKVLGMAGKTGAPEGSLEDFENAVQEAKLDYERMEQEFEAEVIPRKVLAETRECLANYSRPGMKCTPDGPDVSLAEYGACVDAGQAATVNGQLQADDGYYTARAEAASGAFKTHFEALMKRLPEDGSVVTPQFDASGKPVAGSRPPALKHKTVKEILNAEFSGKFSGLGGSFFRAVAVTCEKKAKETVGKERASTRSDLFAYQDALRQKKKLFLSNINKQLDIFAEDYAEVKHAMSGQRLKPRVRQCKDKNDQIQVNCVHDLREAYVALLDGGGENGRTDGQALVQIPAGSSPYTYVPQQACDGLAKCVAAYEGLYTQLQQNRTNEINAANQNIVSWAKGVGSQLASQSKMLEGRLNEMSKLLGTGIELDYVRGEDVKIEKDRDGNPKLMSIPGDLRAFIAGQTGEDTILQLNNKVFAKIGEATGKARADSDKRKREIEASNRKMAGYKTKCAKEYAEKKKEEVEKAASAAIAAKVALQQYCFEGDERAKEIQGQYQEAWSRIAHYSDNTELLRDILLGSQFTDLQNGLKLKPPIVGQQTNADCVAQYGGTLIESMKRLDRALASEEAGVGN